MISKNEVETLKQAITLIDGVIESSGEPVRRHLVNVVDLVGRAIKDDVSLPVVHGRLFVARSEIVTAMRMIEKELLSEGKEALPCLLAKCE